MCRGGRSDPIIGETADAAARMAGAKGARDCRALKSDGMREGLRNLANLQSLRWTTTTVLDDRGGRAHIDFLSGQR